MNWPHFSAPAQAWAGAGLLLALVLTPLRPALESGMSVHMLLQYPALMLAGALLSSAAPGRVRRALAPWNALGVSGLAGVTLGLAVLMIPRVLDLALIDPSIEAGKIAALVLCGALLRPSWHMGGLLIQGFFLGNLLPMMGVIGWLFEDSPLRLCNAYRLDDQQWLGQGLIWLSSAIALAWLLRAMRTIMQSSPRQAPARRADSW
ncbi:MAG: hypothetical protein ABIP61_08535 [Burkholderiaceae bacterium]